MHRVLVADGNIPSLHCRVHGKDFSDCVVYHFSRQNKCASRSNIIGAILREALQGRWGTPVPLRSYALEDALEVHDEGESGLEGHYDRARIDAEISSNSSSTFQSQMDTKFAREHESKPVVSCNGETLDIDSGSEAVTALGSLRVREEASKAEIRSFQGYPPSVCGNTGKNVTEEILPANNEASNMVTAKSCGYEVAEKYGPEPETSADRLNSHHHADSTFSRSSQKKKEQVEGGMDPLEILGVDVMLLVLSNLDAPSLAHCVAVSKAWLLLAGKDGLWQRHCDILWKNKAYFPYSALRKGLTKMGAYSITVAESKRTKITREDLCDHVWEFRFKKVAPDYWLSLDPSWQGLAPMQRYFHADGSQTAGPNDAVWGGHECRYYLVDTPSVDESVRYVRINHWPVMTVSRTENWGWELNNEIYVYNSVPDLKLGGFNDLGNEN